MAIAVKGLEKEQALLALSTAKINAEDTKSIMIKAGIITQEEAETLAITGDTVATNANTAAKAGNLSITNLLRVAWAKLKSVAATNPLAVGITAIVAATYGAIKASEAWTNRLKNQAQESSNAYKDTLEEIESINSELQSNGQRIDELNAKENLTLVEAEELERLKESNRELENTLALKEKIAERESAKANKDAVKYFNEDTNIYNKETGTYDSTHIEVATQYLDEIYKKEQRIHELELEMSRTDDNTEKYRELSGELDMTQKSYEDLLQRVQEYNDIFTELDDYLIEGQDDALIKQLDSFYKYMNEVLYGVAETNTNIIRDTLAKADFQSASKKLEELGKSGELSIDTLSSRFPTLIDYLDQAGISAQELYQYIMALSNPDAINYDEVARQFRESLGIRDGEINGASDQKKWNEVRDSFSEDEWEIALEAYLKVRDQYGEHPEGWTVKDWVANIQNELQTEIVEIDIQLSISETVDQLNTRLKPAFDSLKSAYQDIFTDDGFTLENVGVNMLNSIKADIDELNSMEGVDINIDSSAFEDFARVLTDTASTADDVQNQFNELANTIVRSTGCAEVNSETFDVLSKSLEEMGLVNARSVLEEVITAQKEFQEVSEQLGLTLEEVANATYEETVQMLIEVQAAGQDTQALWNLAVAQGKITDGTIATESNVDALLAEAQAAGLDTAMLTALENVRNGNIKDTKAAQAIIEQAKQDIIDTMSGFKLDFDFRPAISSAKSAGKEAGDAYVDAFEEELEELETLRDQGKITEKEYLDYLRKLYEKYFKDRKKYLKEFQKYESQYLQGMKSLYESALSGITSMLDKQIDAYEDSKDAAVNSLEEQRDAAIAVKEAEKERYEQEIKLIDKQIDAKNDEIKAIEDAASARQREIDLQKAKYELERAQNQRTKLIYSESQGLHYEIDSNGLRNAKEDVDKAKREIEIANIEKEIDLLEDQKDLLNEQIDLIDEQIEKINEYYDNLIADTEKYWDNLIKGMEDYKSRWEELAEIEEQAKIIETLKSLGIETDDILGMSEEAFARFKDEYISILADIYSGNDSMLSALSDTTGKSVDEMGSYIDATQGYIDSLSGIGESLNPVSEVIDGVDESIGNLSSTASEANTNISETASSVSDVATNVGDLETNLGNVNTLITDEQTAFDNLKTKIDEVIEAINLKTEAIQEEQTAVGIATSSEMADFLLLKEKILEIKETLESLGTQDEGLISNIATAIQSLNEISLEEGIIAQFTNLKTAIEQVASAISGGGESSGGEGQSGGSASGQGGSSGGKGSQSSGGSNSLTGAIEQMGNTAGEVIGEADAEGDGTVIGEFSSLETAVTDVTTAIGGGDSEGGEGSKGNSKGSEGENDGSLIGSIVDLGETTNETLGESGGDGVIGKFEQFKVPIQEANEHVHGISDGLAAIDGKEVECTIKINIETSGGIPAFASGTALGGMNLNSAEYNAKYSGNAHVEGTANVTGNWGVRKGGRSLVGELGQEIWVHSKDGTFETVGDNGAEFINTEKGDLIFNHLQTRELLDKGNIVKNGRAYANGTVKYSDGTIITPSGQIFQEYNPDKDDSAFGKLYKAWHGYYDNIEKDVHEINENLSHHLLMERNEQMSRDIAQISNSSSIVNNTRNVQPVVTQNITLNCPNVTNNSGIEYIQKELGHLSLMAIQEPLQRY
ncbi:MAG: hypothetical protein NC489_18465 [Ruminococcus flavefaciens]|nr:hypothetical protein [Ruminococcus flavefaciens]